ncbi:hypothetical protein ACH5RR_014280 [Cinchona calisaya]|uniref:GOLD domain-containing protein n=1 Tax=Cinchona calisaya TaxID=153742 RepID=A0ABD3A3Y0_9GENT
MRFTTVAGPWNDLKIKERSRKRSPKLDEFFEVNEGIESMRFDIPSGTTKCITEDIKTNAMTVGNYAVFYLNQGYPLPDSHRINVRVKSPNGNNYHISDEVESGRFAFTAGEGGGYTACFWAPHHTPATIDVELDWKTGVAAAKDDWTKVAKKGQLQVMEIELDKLYDTAILIHEEMFYLREREEEMQALNRATNSKMATFSFLSLILCLSVAGLQLWHLKTFFERKKLL